MEKNGDFNILASKHMSDSQAKFGVLLPTREAVMSGRSAIWKRLAGADRPDMTASRVGSKTPNFACESLICLLARMLKSPFFSIRSRFQVQSSRCGVGDVER